MINTFRAQGFGCLKNVEAQLTPLHAFIGPNDSGKTTLLKAIETLGRLAHGTFFSEVPHRTYWNAKPNGVLLEAEAPTEFVRIVGSPKGAELTGGTINGESFTERIDDGTRAITEPPARLGLRGIRLLRLDPDAMRERSPLLSLDETQKFFETRGKGLAGLLGSLFMQGEEGPPRALRERVEKLFPGVLRVSAKPAKDMVELEAILRDGTKVPAEGLSEGLLYFLAFFLLEYMSDAKIILLEEPENGLHPARVTEVMDMLRKLTEDQNVQVLISTHSPLVINELKPEEVTLVTRADPASGTKLTPLPKTQRFEERSKVFNLGELWLNYANGTNESELVVVK
ncbi:MAG: AAA family ATPase [Polyangiaceae bacterium]